MAASKGFKGPSMRMGITSPNRKHTTKLKGLALRVNANRLDGTKLDKGDPREAGHYKGSSTKGRPQNAKSNAARRSA